MSNLFRHPTCKANYIGLHLPCRMLKQVQHNVWYEVERCHAEVLEA
jgi:hypothetical protein